MTDYGDFLEKVPLDFDINKIGFILLDDSEDDETEEEEFIDIDYEPRPARKPRRKRVEPISFRTCGICKKVLASKSNLRRHLSKVHPGKEYECHLCSTKFLHRRQLSRHLNAHKRNKFLICEYCGKTEKTNQNMAQHMKIHQEIIE